MLVNLCSIFLYAIGVNKEYKMTTIVGIKTKEGVVVLQHPMGDIRWYFRLLHQRYYSCYKVGMAAGRIVKNFAASNWIADPLLLFEIYLLFSNARCSPPWHSGQSLSFLRWSQKQLRNFCKSVYLSLSLYFSCTRRLWLLFLRLVYDLLTRLIYRTVVGARGVTGVTDLKLPFMIIYKI
jgi:hypothetical protein